MLRERGVQGRRACFGRACHEEVWQCHGFLPNSKPIGFYRIAVRYLSATRNRAGDASRRRRRRRSGLGRPWTTAPGRACASGRDPESLQRRRIAHRPAAARTRWRPAHRQWRRRRRSQRPPAPSRCYSRPGPLPSAGSTACHAASGRSSLRTQPGHAQAIQGGDDGSRAPQVLGGWPERAVWPPLAGRHDRDDRTVGRRAAGAVSCSQLATAARLRRHAPRTWAIAGDARQTELPELPGRWREPSRSATAGQSGRVRASP